MAKYDLISKYDLDMGGMTITIGFTTDEQLFVQIMMVKKVYPLSTISSVTVKKASLSSKIQFDIRQQKSNGKERLIQTVQIDSADSYAKKFTEELKSRIPPACDWRDRLEDATGDLTDTRQVRTYDLQILWFIKAKLFAGHGRTMQIILNYGMLCILTLFLSTPLLVYVIAAGCHRVTTDINGINIKKLKAKYFSWNDIDHFEASKYLIVISGYGAGTDKAYLINFKAITRTGESVPFCIRSLEGKNFVQEMVNRGKMGQEYLELFV